MTARRASLAALLAALGLLATAEAASALPLRPGESATVSQTMAIPALPPKLDFVLLMDATGSMGGEIENAKAGGSTFFDEVRAGSPDSSFAVASFEDYPSSTYGVAAAGDQPHRRIVDLTADRTMWLNAVNALVLRNGGDVPEAQVPALFATVTGESLAWPEGATPAGQGISFRPGAAHFLALVSDAAFHNDKTGSDPYIFSPATFVAPTYAEAVAALSSAAVRVIAADSSGAGVGADMSAIAADTAGASTSLNSNGTGLWIGTGVPGSPGVLGALQAARYPVTAVASCAPLDVVLSQGSWADVAGSSTLSHTQTVTVPAGVDPAQLPPDRKVDCAVSYTWGDVFIGTRHVDVEVSFPASPPLLPGAVSPSNAFSIDRVRGSSRGSATLVLALPAAGRLDILATAKAPSAPGASGRFRVARVRKSVGAAGTVKITLRPSRKAKRILKRRGRLKASTRITFTPTGGSSRSRTKAITLKLRRPRR